LKEKIGGCSSSQGSSALSKPNPAKRTSVKPLPDEAFINSRLINQTNEISTPARYTIIKMDSKHPTQVRQAAENVTTNEGNYNVNQQSRIENVNNQMVKNDLREEVSFVYHINKAAKLKPLIVFSKLVTVSLLFRCMRL